MAPEQHRPDPADVAVAGCGWVAITAVIAFPGLALRDGAVTAFLVAIGGIIGMLWARKRLRS
ncbi:hypothetical protein [Streptomyces cyaneofuscatus]